MLNFISTQTQWYNDKAEKLRKVTMQLENYHPEGMRRKQRRINKALHVAKFIMDLSRSASIAFGSGELTQQQETAFANAGTQIDATQELVNEYYNKKIPPRGEFVPNYTKDNLYYKFWESQKQEHFIDIKRYSDIQNLTNKNNEAK